MRWFEHRASLEIIDESASSPDEIDHLLFRSHRLRRGVDLCAAALVVLTFLFLCRLVWVYRTESARVAISLLSILALLSVLASLLRSPLTELRVTETTVFALGFLGEEAPATILLSWSTITGLSFHAENEARPRGLYAQTGWELICLIPHLNEVQASQVIDAIRSRFPGLGFARTMPDAASPQ